MLITFKFNKYILPVLLFSTLLIACGGGSDDSVPIDTSTPSNLTLTANLVGANTNNPNGDGSGKVIFNFSADNASSYKINFGNGDTAETSSNTISYTYTGAGITNYNVFVSAYKADKFISKNISITIKVNTGLIFFDEFDTPGSPNTSKWTYDIGRGDNGWGNGESQYYTNRTDNVVIANGILKITAKKESYQGAAYTSTRMKTQGKFDFKHGKVEVRAKLPQGGGTWPAIWMLGSNISTVGWPACGEVDIMEHAGNRQGIVQSAMHTPSSNGDTQNKGSQTLADVSTAFHVYAVEWTSQSMVFSVDGVVHYTYNPANKNSSTWPFDAKQFLIFNVAMGGTFGGAIDTNFTESSMEIDYVKVYQ